MKTQKYVRGWFGFTLIEVLVAVWIMGTALLAIVGLNLGNIRSSRSIDEASQAMFMIYDVRMQGYLQAKYNTEIARAEHPQGYELETQILDLSEFGGLGLPMLSDVKIPPIPVISIRTPSGKRFEVLGILPSK